MFLENLSFLQFLVFFTFLCVVSLVIIFHEHNRYKRLSNGCYKNSGQDMIFLCNVPKEEVISKLSRQTKEDTLYYDFFIDNDRYYISVKGIKRYNKRDIYSGLFELKFIYGKKGIYIVISFVKRWQIIYASLYGAEMYEFIICKIGAIPVETVQ